MTAATETCAARRCAAAALAAALTVAPAAHAAGSLPFMPDAAARHHVALLVDEAGLALPLGQWPLPRATVAQALDALPPALPPALADARAALRQALRQADAGEAEFALRSRDETLAGFGDNATPGSAVSLRSAAVTDGPVAAQLGLRLEGSHAGGRPASLRPAGTAFAVEALGWQWQVGSRRSWWGPGWQSSLLLGDNAPALVGASVQRAAAGRSASDWLAWMGPWNAELLVAHLEDVHTPANPFLIGTRLSMRPWPGLDIGLVRTIQWGGSGRPQSAGSLVDALLGLRLNFDDARARGEDSGNQIAGLDLRWRCPQGWRCAGYLQLVGEDEAGRWPSKFLGLYGIEGWLADGRRRWFAELAETGCEMPIGQDTLAGCAYRNHAYPGGYVSAGRWLGAAVGPDARVLTLGWIDTGSGLSARLHAGRVGARIGRFSDRESSDEWAGPIFGFAVSRSWRWRGLRLTPELGWHQVRAAAGSRSEARFGLRVQMPLSGAE